MSETVGRERQPGLAVWRRMMGLGDRPWTAWTASRSVALAVGLLTAAAHRGNVFWDTTYYAHWAQQAAHGVLPYRDYAWEYPPAALPLLVLMGVPALLLTSTGHAFRLVYGLVWVAGALALDAGVFRGVLRRGGGTAAPAARLWLWGLPLLGALSWARLDLFPAVAAMAGVLLAAGRRPTASGAAHGLGGALKVWPAFLAPLQRTHRGTATAVVAATGVVVGVTGLTYLVTGAVGFTDVWAYQARRGLQIESVAALPLLWARHLDLSHLAVGRGFGAQQFTAAATHPVGTTMTLLLAAGLVMVYLAHWRLARIDAGPRGVALSAVTVVLLTLVGDKVLSPQYLLWLIAVATAASLLDPKTWRPFVPWVLATAATTQLEFPLFYRDLTHPGWIGLTALTLRNLLLVGLLAAAIHLLIREARRVAHIDQHLGSASSDQKVGA